MTLRLLAADDNAATLKMIQLAFASEDAVVEVVSNGDIAIDRLDVFRPDVVLADVYMPGYNGYEVCELIRYNKEFATIPVILLNGAFDSLDEDEAVRVQVSGYLTKPFDPSDMIALVERLVRENACRPETGFPDNTSSLSPNLIVDLPETSDLPTDKTDTETEIPAVISAPDANTAQNIPKKEYDVNAEISELGTADAATKLFSKIPPRIRESYFGPNRILEIFNGATFDDETATDDYLISEELVNRVAERAVKKMFPDIETCIRKVLARQD